MENSYRKQAASLVVASGALTGTLADIDLVNRVRQCLEFGTNPDTLHKLLEGGNDLTDFIRMNTH